MQPTFIADLLLVVVAAFIGGYVARTVKLPPVVGYLISGVVFGLVGKTFLTSYDSLFQISQYGVSLLLFTLGFEVSFNTIRRINPRLILIGILQIIVSAIFLVPIFSIFHLNIQTSIFFAFLFSFSSTAVILKMLEEKGLVNSFPGNDVFIFLLIQDLFVVPVMLLLPFLFNSHAFSFIVVLNFIITVLKPVLIFLVIYFLSKIFLSRFLHILFRYPSQELTLLATIFIAIISIGLLTYAGLPQAIAAFFAGILVSEEGKNLAPLSSIRPLRDILLVIFFVLIGMLANGVELITHLPIVVLMTVLILIVRFVVIFVILRVFKFLPSANIFISAHLTNISEFAAIIAQIALFEKFISTQNYEDLLSIFILSLISIPITLSLTKKIYKKYHNTNIVKKLMGESHYFSNPEISKLSNHIIICGHGRVGSSVRKLLEMGNLEYVVLDFDRRAIENLLKNMKNALYGDPTDETILRSAGVKRARILVIASPDSFTQKMIIQSALRLNPKISILCRSQVDEDKYELVNLGVNTIVIPEFEAGLRIGKKVLELSGKSENQVLEMLRKLRKYHFTN